MAMLMANIFRKRQASPVDLVIKLIEHTSQHTIFMVPPAPGLCKTREKWGEGEGSSLSGPFPGTALGHAFDSPAVSLYEGIVSGIIPKDLDFVGSVYVISLRNGKTI